MPEISVIVPVYNTEKTVKKCIDSLQSQTFRDIEIIIVDDGSPDSAGKICDEISKTDSRVRVIHKENGGLSSARNAGMSEAKGDYISFIDSDDYVAPDMYEKMLGRIKADKSDVAICSHFTVDDGGVCRKPLVIQQDVLEKNEIEENLIMPLIGYSFYRTPKLIEGFICRHLFSANLIKGFKFRSERKYYAEDVVFDLDIYPLANRVSILRECLYYYVYNGDSLSNKYREGLWQMMLKLYDFKKNSAEILNNKEHAAERLNAAIIRSALGSIKNLKSLIHLTAKKNVLTKSE